MQKTESSAQTGGQQTFKSETHRVKAKSEQPVRLLRACGAFLLFKQLPVSVQLLK